MFTNTCFYAEFFWQTNSTKLHQKFTPSTMTDVFSTVWSKFYQYCVGIFFMGKNKLSILFMVALTISTVMKVKGWFIFKNMINCTSRQLIRPQPLETQTIKPWLPVRGQVKRSVSLPAKDTDDRHYLYKCCSFNLLSMPTKLADGLGLRDVLL